MVNELPNVAAGIPKVGALENRGYLLGVIDVLPDHLFHELHGVGHLAIFDDYAVTLLR
jgi:hypothetical protein